MISEANLCKMLMTPSGYVKLRCGFDLYPWQSACLDSMSGEYIKSALRTCNDSGKTSVVIAGLVLWHMETFEQSVTVTTSGTNRQIFDQLYPNLSALGEKINRESCREVFRFTRQGQGYCNTTGSRIVSFSTDDPGRAEGWHPLQILRRGDHPDMSNILGDIGLNDINDLAWKEKCSLLIIIDEAKTVGKGIFDAFERCHPTRYLVASSPGASSGSFFDCFNSQKDRYQCFHAAASDCSHLWNDPVRRRDLDEQIRSLPLPLVQSMIFGEFSDQGENRVFDMVLVNKAMSGLIPLWGTGVKRASIDLSGGGDEVCLYIRDGNESFLAGTWREKDDKLVVNEIIHMLQVYQIRPEWVYADDGGLGQVIINEFVRRGWDINRINFSGRARNAKYYANVRAEMYFEFAKHLKLGEIRLEKDDILKEQLSWQEYVPIDGPLRLVPKQQYPSSPDRADSIVMLYYDMMNASDDPVRVEQMQMAYDLKCPAVNFVEQDNSYEGTSGLW